MPHGTGSKIPPAVLDEVFDLSQTLHPATKRVWSHHQLAVHLRERHGIECSHDAVRRALEPMQRIARAAAGDAIRSKILGRMADHLDALDGLIDKAVALTVAKPGKKAPSANVVLGVLDEVRKALETKLRFSGVGERVEMQADVTVEEVPRDDARDELAAVLAREAAAAARGRAPGGAGGAAT